jgi:hypothetical protein
MITVMVPTRGRAGLLDWMLKTLYATVSDPANVEVIARVDDDDQETLDYLATRTTVKVLRGPRLGYDHVPHMFNECADASTGDLLLAGNDDLEFQTPGWDRLLEQAAARYPDGIFDLGVDDRLNNGNYCFPCVSRRVVELFGFFFDDRLLYPDIWLRDVMAPFGRAVRVDEVVILHKWQGMSEDQTQAVYATNTMNHRALYERCVNEGRAKIATVLERVSA